MFDKDNRRSGPQGRDAVLSELKEHLPAFTDDGLLGMQDRQRFAVSSESD